MKIAIGEILEIQSELNNELKNISAKLQTIKSKTANISKLESFQGETASAAKAYFQTVHGESVDNLDETINHLRKNYDQIISEFNSIVDSSSAAVITEDYLNQLNKKVETIENGVLDIHEDGKQVIQSVKDIVALPSPSISTYSKSVNNSRKYVIKVNKNLSDFEKTALKIAKDSMNEVVKQQQKLTKLTAMSIKSGLPNDFVKVAEELGIDMNDKSAISKLADLFKTIRGGSDDVVKFFDETNKLTHLAANIYVLKKMTMKEYLRYAKTGKNKLTQAELRKLNNVLATTLYKLNGKTVKAHIKKYGKELFTRKRLIGLYKHLQPYGKRRRKVFLVKEFDRLFGLDEYRKFKNLTPLKKAGKLGTTFVDELVGKKYKATKKVLKFATVNWKNPVEAYNQSKITKVSVKRENILGKGSKITKFAGKGLGVLSFGLIVTDNIQSNKGDTSKIVVGTAVDATLTGGAAAIGATVGTAIVPPIGTVVGAGVGMAVSWGVNKEWGNPPKSIADRTKDLVNVGVDSAIESTKKIGKTISGWFK
ncbi:hypothetical protein JSQ81_13335 [Sporosarcina sp. Marseille-Q4063]|uniref:T7SS effector LXG polymorphic toxin n=1 Tax=Sporosarcina sp. Marseille-Q4063 TaxID=2810514 RepID=UPI001BAF95A0|nr:T7SS effector LXG polymorphic toxin [Sporosarcina sp. Marseille-Q4063]QUW20797.1 hypothetical protein JSQ81_13335 [Sporosarcina sp. Marseille-Q4063]